MCNIIYTVNFIIPYYVFYFVVSWNKAGSDVFYITSVAFFCWPCHLEPGSVNHVIGEWGYSFRVSGQPSSEHGSAVNH